MAKKKMNNPQQKVTVEQTPPPTMDEITEKMESLKSLNAMLLKETVERRQQVDSLLESKECLESELTRSNSEKDSLKSEVARLSEGLFTLEVEKNVTVAFVSQQAEAIERERLGVERKMKSLEGEMEKILKGRDVLVKAKGEKEREIELLNKKLKQLGLQIEKERNFSKGVCLERDEIKDKLDIQVNETKALGNRLMEAENKGRLVQEEAENLGMKYKQVVKETEDGLKKIESLKRDKESLEKSLQETHDTVEHMRKEIEGIRKEKEALEEDKKLQMIKRNELEKIVSGLEEMVESFRKEEENLLLNVADMEKRCVDCEEREKEMRKQIDEMVKAKDEVERELLKVLAGKDVVEKERDDYLKQLDGLKLKLDAMTNEKSELLEAKVRKESELVESEKQVAELRKSLLELEDSCRVQKGEITGLESEVRSYKDSLECVSIERDEAMKGIEREKQNVVSLLEKIKLMEKNLEESLKTVEELRTENAKSRDEKEDLEGRRSLLEQEIASAKNELAAARKELHAMKLKVEAAALNSDQILKGLNSTAKLVCTKDDGSATCGGGKEINGDIEPYTAELEAIKNAFKRKEKTLEDMKSQLDFLQHSVVEARKKKNFWTAISSATTICAAAISLAYVARGGH